MASDIFASLAASIKDGVEAAMETAGAATVELMEQGLREGGHAGSGELIASMGYEVKKTDDAVTADVYMAEYGGFIESGTGAAHGVPGGRQGSWRYQDRDGNWHTTDGMDADPFVEPAVSSVASALAEAIGSEIVSVVRQSVSGGGSDD